MKAILAWWTGVKPPLTAVSAGTAAVAVAAIPRPAPIKPAAQPCPLAELVAEHARKVIYYHEDRSKIRPLPPVLNQWLYKLNSQQLLDVIGSNTEALQRHIDAGLAGSTALGPFRLPAVPPLPQRDGRGDGASGKGGKGGGPSRVSELAQILEDAGYAMSHRPRF